MRKIAWILLAALMLIFTLGYAQQVIYVTGPKTILWDAVIMTGSISYDVYVEKGGVETFLGNTALTTYDVDVTLLGEGTYIVGVKTVRVIDGQTFDSDINWSNVDGVWTPVPFVLAYYLPVPAPENLRMGE